MMFVKEESQIWQKQAFTKVICVACIKDLAVWKIASKYIPRSIFAKSYEVIVPDNEIHDFRINTDQRFEVAGESYYLNGVDLEYVRSRLVNFKDRAGWYLQQFIKINACCVGSQSDVFLIWDADTVPLKQLEFFDSEGRLTYYKGAGIHNDYFETIGKILGLQRKVEYSFIAQCFPIKRVWAQEFCNEIERKSNTDWITAVLSNISGDTGAGFSEYESLGTFITYRYPHEFVTTDKKWSHIGNLLIGGIDNLNSRTIDSLSKQYDFIAFEQSQQKYGFMKRQRQRLRLYLRKLASKQTVF